MLMFGLLFFAAALTSSSVSMTVAKDSSFSIASREFLPSETVFVRVESKNPGLDKREITLRDNQYQVLQTFIPQRSGFGPYSYTMNFPAPQNSGFYSIESRIENDGSQDVDVQTIKVGKVTNANVKVTTKVQSSSQKQEVKGEQTKPQPTPTPTIEPEATPQPTPTTSPDSESDPFGFIKDFFETLLKFIFPFMK